MNLPDLTDVRPVPSTTSLYSLLQTQRKTNPNTIAAVANSQSGTSPLPVSILRKLFQRHRRWIKDLVYVSLSHPSQMKTPSSGVPGRDESPELGLPLEGGVWIAVTSDPDEGVDVGVSIPMLDESSESVVRVDGV
jgi:hypothetical protein